MGALGLIWSVMFFCHDVSPVTEMEELDAEFIAAAQPKAANSFSAESYEMLSSKVNRRALCIALE